MTLYKKNLLFVLLILILIGRMIEENFLKI